MGAVAFTLGFVALTLANSELFTENLLVPITAIAARKASWMSLVRLGSERWCSTSSADGS